jgi:hypothetical protein
MGSSERDVGGFAHLHNEKLRPFRENPRLAQECSEMLFDWVNAGLSSHSLISDSEERMIRRDEGAAPWNY